MKFKMSEKSLFAILLRSPWWASLLIVLVISLVAGALLPREHAVLVALGTFPFVVIAAMAAWRQWRAPSPARQQAALQRAGTLAWRDFAAWVAEAFQGQGYTVTPLDGEVADFRLLRGGQVLLLSCRRWKAANHGVENLRALQAACEREGARGLYLSLAPVSGAAQTYAKQQGLQLVDGLALGLLLAGAGATT